MKRETDVILISLSIMYFISWSIEKIVINYFQNNLILRYAGLFFAGFLTFFMLTNKLQTYNKIKKAAPKKHILILFMAQFFYLLITIILNLIIKNNTTSTKLSTFQLTMILLVGPIFEEYVFRKRIFDKTSGNCILLSTITFGIVHIVSRNVAITIAAMYSGFIWSILYYNTRNFTLTVLFHIVQNFLLMYMTDFLMNLNENLLGIYILFLLIVGIVGLVLLIKNQAKILPDKNFNIDFIKTKGFIIFIATMIVVSLV